ncbi:MAG TPA: phenylacetate--CoA ligase family protein [Candidatus Dormibacteraeota bacterium]|nr:phenylacetate--CoA ligase family protein [Candidatus Dormibacteraeota bacterium]
MSFLHWRSRTALLGLDIVRPVFLRSYPVFLVTSTLSSRPLEQLSPYASWRAAQQAKKHVPAYQQFLSAQGYRDDPRIGIPDRFKLLPTMDKDNYIKAYPTESRCRGGRIPLRFTQIDESSGSSGRPYNWVRPQRELHNMHLEMSQFIRYLFGENLVVINAFSMGAWATGMNVAEALRRVAMVKSTGPDLDKIIDTLEFFGPGYRYLICGYPPFLKHVIDAGSARGVDWSRYRIGALVGGEAISEEMREYIERCFRPVYSAYGASDVDMGIAAELPLTVWMRRKAASDESLRRALFGSEDRFPMLFQYNPVDYNIETNDADELIITVNREKALSPRIRYNLHDAGGTITYADAMKKLATAGLLGESERVLGGQPRWRMPFLYLFGRSDSTVSYMGANIYPADVEKAIFQSAADHERFGAFCVEMMATGKAHEERPYVHVEALRPLDESVARDELRKRLVSHLASVNRDFRTALSEDLTAGDIQVMFHQPGTGPFAANSSRIKRVFKVERAAKEVAE